MTAGSVMKPTTREGREVRPPHRRDSIVCGTRVAQADAADEPCFKLRARR
jgi:hypothetical protein